MNWINQLLDERKINVPVDAELDLVLTKLKKVDLKRITDAHGLKRTASLTKGRLNERIMEALGNSERLEYILYGMSDKMLADFLMLASEDFVAGDALMSTACAPLLDLGYIYPVMNGDIPVFVMPQIVKDAYESINQEEFSEAKARFDLIYHYMRGATSLYGIADFPHLVKLFNSQQDFEITPEEALNTLICKMTFQDDVQSYGPLMVDGALLMDDSDMELKVLAQIQGDKPYYMATNEEMMQYGSDAGYFTEELDAIAQFLENYFPEADCRGIASDIGAAFSYKFTPKNALLALEIRGLELPSFEASQQLFGLVQTAYNQSRVWEHKGHTPQEMGGKSQANKPIVVPSTAPIRSEKIGRNDPCLCGSGKKYKKCCQ